MKKPKTIIPFNEIKVGGTVYANRSVDAITSFWPSTYQAFGGHVMKKPRKRLKDLALVECAGRRIAQVFNGEENAKRALEEFLEDKPRHLYATIIFEQKEKPLVFTQRFVRLGFGAGDVLEFLE